MQKITCIVDCKRVKTYSKNNLLFQRPVTLAPSSEKYHDKKSHG